MSALNSRRDFLRRLPLLAAPVATVSPWAQSPSPDAASMAERATFNVRRFGAKGNAEVKDTEFIQAAIDAAGRQGGCVYFPPGRYLCGSIHLRSHVTLQLENGATLAAAPERGDFDEYEKLDFNSFSDQETTDFNYALIRGRGVEHIALFGPGRIDMARTKRGGPKPVALKLCRNIVVRDLTIENAPNYNLSFLGCDFVNISGVTIHNGYCDGIDPDCCRYVRISDCFVESWDDAIVPKASFALGYKRSTEHVTVSNCVLTTACNGLKLGTESSGDFKDIAFNNCSIFSNPERWKDRPAIGGVALEMVDGGALERIAVSNLTMRDVRVPIFVRLGNRGRAQAEPQPQHLRMVSISDIVATGAALTSSLSGIPGHPLQGITLRNIRLAGRGGGKPGLAAQTIPENESKYPDGNMFGELPAYGLYCRHVTGFVLEAIEFTTTEPDARPALVLDGVSEGDLRTLVLAPPSGAMETVRLNDVADLFVSDSRALSRTTTWARISGAKTQRVCFAGNDLANADKGIEVNAEVPAGAVTRGS